MWWVFNSSGGVDKDYRGIINVILINDASKVLTVVKGMKIAQSLSRLKLAVSLEDT